MHDYIAITFLNGSRTVFLTRALLFRLCRDYSGKCHNPAKRSLKIPLNSNPLTGFSFETKALSAVLIFLRVMRPSAALFRQLGPGVVRVGGNSADQVSLGLKWTGFGSGKEYLPPDLERLAAFLKATDWKRIYSINHREEYPGESWRSEASYVAKNFWAIVSLGIEIGNEPGAYSKNRFASECLQLYALCGGMERISPRQSSPRSSRRRPLRCSWVLQIRTLRRNS